jgi:hypothetical protein
MASPIPDPIPAVPAGSPGGSGRGSGEPDPAAPADLAHLRAALAGLESVADYLGDPPASVSADLIPGLNLNHGHDLGDAARS